MAVRRRQHLWLVLRPAQKARHRPECGLLNFNNSEGEMLKATGTADVAFRSASFGEGGL